MQLRFLGAAGTVTGSKYLLATGQTQCLIDCGLFQGFKQLRLRNWAPLPVRPDGINFVVLTHAHLDHSGYLPLLIKNGFRGPVYCTEATYDLCKVLLPDSGFLNEKDADFANRHGFSKHRPALPLYTREEAERSLEYFEPIERDRAQSLDGGITLTLRRAGHILGAATVEVEHGGTRIVFSGDLGRLEDAVMYPPETVSAADYLVLESTYGDREHQALDPEEALAEIVNRTIGRGGSVIIPAFAVGRAQAVLFHLHRLKRRAKIPDVGVFLDSPMAVAASRIFLRHCDDHRLTEAECQAMRDAAQYVEHVNASKALDKDHVPKVIISASGMATGGRVLHHLKSYAPDRRNTILFAGFQAGGTRGDAMVRGAKEVKIHGEYVPVRAEVENLQMFSAHADRREILEWLKGFKAPPKATFITHGEPRASDELRHLVEEALGWTCVVAEHLSEEELS